MACPFPRGALPHLYSCTWIRGYGPLDENDPNFIFNPNTFEITIVNASIEDSPSDYVCQVKVENPLGNDWTVRSQQISLNVTETVADQIQPHPSSSSITSTAPSVAETSVVSPNGNPKITLVVVVGITALIIIIALISTIVVIVVLASIKRKRSVPTNDIELARTNLGSSTSIFMDTSHFQHTLSPVPIHTFRLPTNTATVHTAASSGTSSLFVKPLLETRDEYPPSCNVEFIGSIQVVDCDRQGGEYRNAEHGIHIRIPKDAVQDSIELEIGFAVHGHFTFPDHMRPVSVILWMNVADNPDFEFSKEIKVTLPHYLQLSTSDSRSKTDELGCMFAATVIEETQSEPMAFTKLDDDKVGYMQRDGCIKTKRAGYMCLCAKKSFIDANSAYYLVTVPTPIARPSDGWSIPFYMCYHLDTFVEVGCVYSYREIDCDKAELL
jgi:hypothetical protein